MKVHRRTLGMGIGFALGACALLAVVSPGTALAARTAGPAGGSSPALAAAGYRPVTLPAPPAGFNPLRASQAQLVRYGFPVRPSSGQALRTWTYAMSHATHYEVPGVARVSTVRHTPPWLTAQNGSTARHASYSGNWGGKTISYSVIDDAAFTWESGQWYQPSVPADSAYPKSGWDQENDGAPDASFWTGIGITDLIQAGADSVSTNPQTYEFWYEDYPLNTVWETSPSITAGDTGWEFVEYNSNGTSSYFLENVTTGGYTPYENESSPYVGFRQLDYINEFLGSSFPDFGSATFSYGDGGNGSSTVYLQSGNSSTDIMTSTGTSSGEVLSSPSAVDNTYDSFTETAYP